MTTRKTLCLSKGLINNAELWNEKQKISGLLFYLMLPGYVTKYNEIKLQGCYYWGDFLDMSLKANRNSERASDSEDKILD